MLKEFFKGMHIEAARQIITNENGVKTIIKEYKDLDSTLDIESKLNEQLTHCLHYMIFSCLIVILGILVIFNAENLSTMIIINIFTMSFFIKRSFMYFTMDVKRYITLFIFDEIENEHLIDKTIDILDRYKHHYNYV